MNGQSRTILAVFGVGPIVGAALSFIYGRTFTLSPSDGWHHYFPEFWRMMIGGLTQSVFAVTIALLLRSKFVVPYFRPFSYKAHYYFLWGALIYLLSGVLAASLISLALLSAYSQGLEPWFMTLYGGFLFLRYYLIGGASLVLGGASGLLVARLGHNAF